MRKRKKKKIAIAVDEEGRYLNCYGKFILWTKDDLKRGARKARRLCKLLQWG